MRFLLIAAVLFAFAPKAMAKDIVVTLSPDEQSSIVASPNFEENCIGSAVSRGDAGVCRQVYNFLVGLANKVKTEQAKPEPAKPAEAKPEAAAPAKK
jgi:hypothetical protein